MEKEEEKEDFCNYCQKVCKNVSLGFWGGQSCRECWNKQAIEHLKKIDYYEDNK